jgi:endonuclease/exonuclease/phosphatase family metal-dependent hydrolase
MQHSLSITTWNVLNAGYECEDYYHEDAHPFLHWREGRGERAALYLGKLDSDIYCLQEVSQAMATEIHLSLGKKKYDMLWEARTRPGDKVEDGCAILHRRDQDLAFIRDHAFRYESGKHIFLSCKFRYHGEVLWVVNTHVNWATRETDLLTLQEKINDTSNARTVVMGDFNAERNEAWYQSLGKHGLVDALHNLTHLPYSYNSGKLSKWIDFFLLNQLPLESVQGVCVGNDWHRQYLFKDTALPSAEVPSDHLPVTVRLSL